MMGVLYLWMYLPHLSHNLQEKGSFIILSCPMFIAGIHMIILTEPV